MKNLFALLYSFLILAASLVASDASRNAGSRVLKKGKDDKSVDCNGGRVLKKDKGDKSLNCKSSKSAKKGKKSKSPTMAPIMEYSYSYSYSHSYGPNWEARNLELSIDNDSDSIHRSISELSSPVAIQGLVDEIGENIDLYGNFYEKEGLLSKNDCMALMKHFDDVMDVKSMTGPFQRDDILIKTSELISIIGEEKFKDILNFVHESLGMAPVSGIVLRRVHADGINSLATMDWHIHEKISNFKEGTVAIALNADEDITGGDLYYLRHDGPVKAQRSQGKGYAHSYNILHSVEDYKGTRYSLYVHVNQDDEVKGYEFE